MNGKTISIAVCGAGDGAPQDFLRIVTGLKSAKDLMLQIDSELSQHLAIQLAAEEDNVRRHHAWLGKLVNAERKERMGRNPATGEQIKIAAKTTVKFRIAKAATDAIAPPNV